jgi:hypothetical protein
VFYGNPDLILKRLRLGAASAPIESFNDYRKYSLPRILFASQATQDG